MSERATEEDTVTHQATVDDKLGDGTWDEEWLAAPRRRSRTRPVLVLALGASLVFLAGVEVQRHFGTAAASASASAFPAGAMPSGGPPSGMAMPSGAAATSGGQPSDAPATDTTAGAAGEVIGTVVAKHGSVWVVQDLGGTRHRVTVTGDTALVREQPLAAAEVRRGATVDITLGSDGASADSVTVR
ncbi:MAG: hypothetical protein U0R80_04465 [Nocardioidaceae bacterium]